ncbi:MAG: DUF2290 domain-containing protein [Candidatus Electrothrix sp. AUS4]|nr:DUF2290 domain-containing protein [Candidatus Electrothrix sp. AUS4]
MPSPEKIRQQMERLTAELVGLSLCDRQNFPATRNVGSGYCEVGVGSKGSLSYALKNISYQDIYTELDRLHSYNMRMLDGALIHMMYRFKDNQLEAHRLAFFPSPFLEEFQNNPDIYIEDEVYAEVIMKNIVPFPLRFDFDCRKEVAVEIDHPKSHLTLGQYQNCRIPVSAPLTPHNFISFVLQNFYNTAYQKYSNRLTIFADSFEKSITKREKELLHIHLPNN